MNHLAIPTREKITIAVILSLVLASILALEVASFCLAQTTQTDWLKIIGGSTDDYPVDLIRASDGGYVILGSTGITTQYGPTDTCWVIKVNPSGNAEWNKTYGNAGLVYGQSICQVGNEYFVAGASFSEPMSNWLARLDSNGQLVTSKTYGPVSGSGFLVAPCDNGLLLFSQEIYPSGDRDAKIIKTDLQGNTQWSRTYGGSEIDALGNFFQTPEGNYVLAGTTFSFGAGSTDFWIVCIDSSGNSLWSKTYGYSTADTLRCSLQTSGGGYLMAGSSMAKNGGVLVVKTSPAGIMEWNRTYNEPGTPFEVLETSDGGYILTCSNSVLKIDSNGNQQWMRTYDADVRCMVRASDGGYILAGCIPKEGFNRNIWLAKIDATGTLLASTTTPTGSSTPVPQPVDAAIINTETGVEQLAKLMVTGNISASQMSTVKVSTNQTEGSANVSMLVTGAAGTAGFGNITIPKALVVNNLVPEVYIDGQKVQNQGYTQNKDNYYVWFTTHFSKHQVSLAFTEQEQQQQDEPPSAETNWPIIGGAIIAVIGVLLASYVLVVRRRKK